MTSKAKIELKHYLNDDPGGFLTRMIKLSNDFRVTKDANEIKNDLNDLFLLQFNVLNFERSKEVLGSESQLREQTKIIRSILELIDRLPEQFCNFCHLRWKNSLGLGRGSQSDFSKINFEGFQDSFPTYEELLSIAEYYWKIESGNYGRLLIGVGNYFDQTEQSNVSDDYIFVLHDLFLKILTDILFEDVSGDMKNKIIFALGCTTFLVKQIQGERNRAFFYVMTRLSSELAKLKNDGFKN